MKNEDVKSGLVIKMGLDCTPMYQNRTGTIIERDIPFSDIWRIEWEDGTTNGFYSYRFEPCIESNPLLEFLNE